jgi:hypothetical protein
VLGYSVEVGLGDFTVASLKYMAEETQKQKLKLESKGIHHNLPEVTASVVNFTNLNRQLERRLRIQEIGEHASVYLQARIRKLIACKRLRRDVLRRLEYIPASRTRGAFFLDSETNHPWYRWPRMCSNDRPASPSTMSRRLNAEQRRRDARFAQYLAHSSADSESCFRYVASS